MLDRTIGRGMGRYLALALLAWLSLLLVYCIEGYIYGLRERPVYSTIDSLWLALS